jgi:hypothetical protein
VRTVTNPKVRDVQWYFGHGSGRAARRFEMALGAPDYRAAVDDERPTV